MVCLNKTNKQTQRAVPNVAARLLLGKENTAPFKAVPPILTANISMRYPRQPITISLNI